MPNVVLICANNDDNGIKVYLFPDTLSACPSAAAMALAAKARGVHLRTHIIELSEFDDANTASWLDSLMQRRDWAFLKGKPKQSDLFPPNAYSN